MKLFSKGAGSEFPPEKEGQTWIQLENMEEGQFSVRDAREREKETVRTTFVREPDPPSLHVWYRPTCSAGWVIPVLYFVVVIGAMAVADITFDDYYIDLVVAISVSGAFCLLVAFYYIGRYLDMRYSAHSPTCDMLWRYVFFPVGCMRANATNLMDSAGSSPDQWKEANGERRKTPAKKSKD